MATWGFALGEGAVDQANDVRGFVEGVRKYGFIVTLISAQ